MTTGELIVALSGMSGVSALTNLMGITAGGKEISGAGGFSGIAAAPAIVYRDREVVVTVPVEKVIERVVEVPTIVRIPATIPGLPEGEVPRIEMIDGVPILEASRSLIEARDRVISKREADNARVIADNARLSNELEAMTAMFFSAAASQ